MEKEMKKMNYRGFVGNVVYSEDDGCFCGKIEGIRSLVMFDGADMEAVEKDFHEAVDSYIELKLTDVTGAELAPGYPEHCQGNGKHPDFEICCDECDYFLRCFPEWEKGETFDE